MHVVATNLGTRRTVQWKGKPVTTGIFKYPVGEGIFLGAEDVEGDQVIDRRYHGGFDKACYAFSADHYPFWKSQFPELEWDYGMFGENLTIAELDEKSLRIGDTFKVGEAIIQVSEPRQPCMKLNVRFNSSKMVKAFTKYGSCGSYFRVLQPGQVQSGDKLILMEKGEPELFVADVFRLIYTKGEPELRALAIAHPRLAKSTIEDLI